MASQICGSECAPRILASEGTLLSPAYLWGSGWHAQGSMGQLLLGHSEADVEDWWAEGIPERKAEIQARG